jgi:hypothetical protein
MSVERIEAAIAKLETLKAESTPGPWRLARAQHVTHAIYGEKPGQEVIGSTPRYGGLWSADDGELIVTLHRTIDAQLAILRAVVESVPIWVENDGPMTDAELVDNLLFELALADAILGES